MSEGLADPAELPRWTRRAPIAGTDHGSQEEVTGAIPVALPKPVTSPILTATASSPLGLLISLWTPLFTFPSSTSN